MYGKNIYGKSIYGDSKDKDLEIEQWDVDLIKWLPDVYFLNDGYIKNVVSLQEAIEPEICNIKYQLEDIKNQFFLETATWGLAIYEEIYNLEVNPPGIDYAQRREIIKAKKRGRGTTTKQMIKDTAEAFSGGEVDIEEYSNEFRLVIKFIGVLGVPRNMKAFTKMLEDILPCHLDFEFKYTYTTCEMLIRWDVRCEDLINENITCKELKTYKPKGVD